MAELNSSQKSGENGQASGLFGSDAFLFDMFQGADGQTSFSSLLEVCSPSIELGAVGKQANTIPSVEPTVAALPAPPVAPALAAPAPVAPVTPASSVSYGAAVPIPAPVASAPAPAAPAATGAPSIPLAAAVAPTPPPPPVFKQGFMPIIIPEEPAPVAAPEPAPIPAPAPVFTPVFTPVPVAVPTPMPAPVIPPTPLQMSPLSIAVGATAPPATVGAPELVSFEAPALAYAPDPTVLAAMIPAPVASVAPDPPQQSLPSSSVATAPQQLQFDLPLRRPVMIEPAPEIVPIAVTPAAPPPAAPIPQEVAPLPQKPSDPLVSIDLTDLTPAAQVDIDDTDIEPVEPASDWRWQGNKILLPLDRPLPKVKEQRAQSATPDTPVQEILQVSETVVQEVSVTAVTEVSLDKASTNPMSKAVPSSAPIPAQIPVSASAPRPTPSVPVPMPSVPAPPVPQVASISQVSPVPQIASVPDPVPTFVSQAASLSQPKQQPKAQPQPGFKLEPKQWPKPQPQLEPKPQAEAQPQPGLKLEPKQWPETQPKPQPQPGPVESSGLQAAPTLRPAPASISVSAQPPVLQLASTPQLPQKPSVSFAPQTASARPTMSELGTVDVSELQLASTPRSMQAAPVVSALQPDRLSEVALAPVFEPELKPEFSSTPNTPSRPQPQFIPSTQSLDMPVMPSASDFGSTPSPVIIPDQPTFFSAPVAPTARPAATGTLIKDEALDIDDTEDDGYLDEDYEEETPYSGPRFIFILLILLVFEMFFVLLLINLGAIDPSAIADFWSNLFPGSD